MKMLSRAALAIVAALTFASCTVHQTEPPSVNAPSELALAIGVQAIPDSIGQDGGSQSVVRITAKGPDAKPMSAVPFRIDMIVDGIPADYGRLSARNVVTGSDGLATVVFTAPAAPAGGNTGTCSGLPGTCVTIVATPTSTNFMTVNPQSVTIRLVPMGVILPPADTPTATFQFSPAQASANQPVLFDGSASCGGSMANGTCQSANQIVAFDWNFGDGTTGTGATLTHNFMNVASYVVTLTVTNDRGMAASTSNTVTVTASALPTPVIDVSPTTIAPGQTVFFSGLQSSAPPGRTIVRYDWDFGDGMAPGTGATTTHAYQNANTYTTTLTVTDDLGQKKSAIRTVIVK